MSIHAARRLNRGSCQAAGSCHGRREARHGPIRTLASKDEKAEHKRLKDEYLRAEQVASAARMPLDRAQLAALLDHVEAAVQASGCDHTLAATEAWAAREGIDLERLHEGLEEYGGFCDCEVVMNVEADEVFTAVRTSRA